jgi:hypothetical protein
MREFYQEKNLEDNVSLSAKNLKEIISSSGVKILVWIQQLVIVLQNLDKLRNTIFRHGLILEM